MMQTFHFKWAEFVTLTIRTTNNFEAFHRKLNSLFNSSHPNIFNFIEVLKIYRVKYYEDRVQIVE